MDVVMRRNLRRQLSLIAYYTAVWRVRARHTHTRVARSTWVGYGHWNPGHSPPTTDNCTSVDIFPYATNQGLKNVSRSARSAKQWWLFLPVMPIRDIIHVKYF